MSESGTIVVLRAYVHRLEVVDGRPVRLRELHAHVHEAVVGANFVATAPSTANRATAAASAGTDAHNFDLPRRR